MLVRVTLCPAGNCGPDQLSFSQSGVVPAVLRGNEADLVTELDEVPKHSALLHMCFGPTEGVSQTGSAGHVRLLRNSAALTSPAGLPLWLYSTIHMAHRPSDGMHKHTYFTLVYLSSNEPTKMQTSTRHTF